MRYLLLYIFTVVVVNMLFDILPVISLPGGEKWPPAALVVGLTFVIRDYAQRDVGHWVLPAMFIGGGLSWFMATPSIALASMAAFLTGEFLDWAVYTFTGRPFSQRVLLSSAISTPVDSLVFLGMTGYLTATTLVLMTASKMLGALVIFYFLRKKERVEAQ